MEGNDGQYYLNSDVILLPCFWRLQGKFNMRLAQIHLPDDVPKFKEKREHSMERYFQIMTP